ncbi:MAG TPA: STAS/SEC14 domain-containing protein [Polyangiales bacterium]|nr:STAS/SEC14 domain-containing protein [Polyangiales bacterium]
MPLYIDRETLPLLRLRYVGDYSDPELTEFLRKLESVLETPGRKAAVIDLSQAAAGTATQRQIQAAWIGKQEKVLAREFSAAAIVTDSAIIRGTVTAVFWIRPLPFPTRVTATVKLAEEWLAPYLEPTKT